MGALIRPSRLAFEGLVVLLAAWQVYDLAQAMSARLSANFDLEWMEGATLITGLRAHNGLPFYTAPQTDYIPFIYPPLYAWILGALAHVFPLGYTLGRGVSIACTVGAALTLAWAARREGARWPMALGVSAAFLGCYEEGGSFYDLVRIDALAMFLTALALVFGRIETTRGAIASGLLLALAFTAKHNMALFGLPIALWRWRALGVRSAVVFGAASVLPALAFVAGMHLQSDGLFLRYLLEVPSRHSSVWTRGLPNLQRGRVEGAQAEIVRALPVVTAVLVAGLRTWPRTPSGAYWGAGMLTGLVMVSLMRAHQGGYVNVLVPMFWLLPLGFVLMDQAWAAPGPEAPRSPIGQGIARLRPWAGTLITALLALQLWEGKGELRKFLPTDVQRRAAAALVDELRTLPGPVLMPHGPWYPVLAGHAPSIALIALWDVDHAGGPLQKGARVFDRALKDRHWATVVTADDKLGHGLKEHYEAKGRLKAPSFGTRTGWPIRFGGLWVPREDRTTDTRADGGSGL